MMNDVVMSMTDWAARKRMMQTEVMHKIDRSAREHMMSADQR